MLRVVVEGKVERRVFREFQTARKRVRSRFVVFDFGKTSTRSVATGSKGSNLEKENDFWVLGLPDGGATAEIWAAGRFLGSPKNIQRMFFLFLREK